MRAYRKKPIVILAEKWTTLGDVPEAGIRGFTSSDITKKTQVCEKCGALLGQHGLCPTLEGDHIVCPGDWIIRGIQGEYYPCKPDIFEETYEPVSPT